MASPINIRVFRNDELCFSHSLAEEALAEETSRAIELGRQRPGEPAEFHYDTATSRLIIAPIDDKLVSRKHLRLSCVPQDNSNSQIEIHNLSKKRSINVQGYGKLIPDGKTRRPLPTSISFEGFSVRVEMEGKTPDLKDSGRTKSTNKTLNQTLERTQPHPVEVRSLEHPTIAPNMIHHGHSTQGVLRGSLTPPETPNAGGTILQPLAQEQYSSDQLIHWLSETMEVLQRAAGAPDFLIQAVDSVERIVGLDAIAALKYEGGKWLLQAQRTSGGASDAARAPSQTILSHVLESKRTVYQMPEESTLGASLMGIKAIVASPILNPDGDVIGAIYGSRFGTGTAGFPQITELEATMVEVIACGAAAGIARESQQKKAMEMRIQFERCFPPQLIDELETNPQMLDGQEAEISVLFCDVVGFSSISSRITSQLTLEWISDVMDRLSEAVLENDGVVVDFIGDELMAMWGAPKADSAHAEKACLAAGDLMRCRAEIDAKWLDRIAAPIDFRIGICSGIASVGNTGSSKRLKYGPLGNTVNLASRLQSAAKQLGVKQLISQSTAALLPETSVLNCRTLGTASFVNISNPIEVFELLPIEKTSNDVTATFRKVVDACHENDLHLARSLLDQLIRDYPDDKPAQLLADRIHPNQEFDQSCIWRLDSK